MRTFYIVITWRRLLFKKLIISVKFTVTLWYKLLIIRHKFLFKSGSYNNQNRNLLVYIMLTIRFWNVNLRQFKWLIICYLIKSASVAGFFHFCGICSEDVDSIWVIAFSVILGVIPIYFIVVETLLWPRNLLTLNTLTPSSIKWVAMLCLNWWVCICSGSSGYFFLAIDKYTLICLFTLRVEHFLFLPLHLEKNR